MTTYSIAILSRLASPTIRKELKPALEQRGHTVSVVDVSSVPLKGFLNHTLITSLLKHDLIYYRSGLTPEAVIELGNYLSQHGKKLVNFQFDNHPFANAKSYETLHADQAGLLVPNSLFNVDPDFKLIAEALGTPFVAKSNLGARGEDVHLIDSPGKLTAVTNHDRAIEYIYQEFIPHKSEYRVHLVGGTPVAMYKRTPPENDFRSNVSQGGKMLPVEPSLKATLTEQASKAAQIFDFEVIAADFMLNTNDQKLYFTEINLNPGWELGDQTATGVNLSSITADYFEQLMNE